MRGQASTESLFIIGFAALLTFALIYAVLPVVLDFANYSEVAQAERSLARIASAARAASSYGSGTYTTLHIYLPAGTLSWNRPYLVYSVRGRNSDILQKVGDIQVIVDGGEVRAGTQKITVEKKLDSVVIEIG